MKKVLTLLLILIFLSGCNYLRKFPSYSEVYVEHPDYVQLFRGIKAEQIRAISAYPKIKQRVLYYLEKVEDIEPEIATGLNALRIQKGMRKGHVFLLTGEPTKKKILRDNKELWIYKGDRYKKGECDWYYHWAKLMFEHGVLIDIQLKNINIL